MATFSLREEEEPEPFGVAVKRKDTYRCESCGRWVFWTVKLRGAFGPDRVCENCARSRGWLAPRKFG